MSAIVEFFALLGFRFSGEDELRRFEAGMQRAERSLDHFARRVTAFAAPLALGLGTAVAGFAVQMTRTGMEFEDQLTEIQKKAGATAAEMGKVREEILDLATSGKLASTVDEIAAAFERGAAAGLPLEGLREFALLSAKAADAFGMSAEEVGNSFAGFEKALGVPRAKLQETADLINSLADSGIADEADIVRFMDAAGAMAKTVGLTVEQTATFGAALANLKVPAGEAATAMNAILTKIVAPDALSDTAREAFGGLVGNVDAFAKSLDQDADGAMVGLLERLQRLDKAGRAGAIAKIFGQENVDVVSQLVVGLDELKRNLDQAGNRESWLGSLDKSFALKLDDTSSRWQIFVNNLKASLVSLGQEGLPVISRLLDKASAFLKRIREDGTLDRWADNVAVAFEKIGTGAGDFIAEMMDAIQTLGMVFDTINGVMKDPEAAFRRFADAAIAQIDRILAAIDEGLGGALTRFGLLAPKPTPTSGDPKMAPKGIEGSARNPTRWDNSKLGSWFTSTDPSQAVTDRISGAYATTSGGIGAGDADAMKAYAARRAAQPSSGDPGLFQGIADRISGMVGQLAGLVADMSSSPANNAAMLQFLNGLQGADRMNAAAVNATISNADNRSFPVTNNISAPVTVNVQQATQAPAAVGRAIATAVGKEAVQSRAAVVQSPAS